MAGGPSWRRRNGFLSELSLRTTGVRDSQNTILIICSVFVVTLLTSFDLTLLNTPETHKAGKQLNLILTRNCITDLTSVTGLHISDHCFIQFSVSLPPTPTTSPPLVTFCHNLRPLSPSHFCSILTSSPPPIDKFMSHPTDTATNTLLSTLTASLDTLSPVNQACAIFSLLPVAHGCYL